MRQGWLTLLWGLLLSCQAPALPQTPVAYVNGKVTLAQIGEKGRVYIDFDVRPLGGAGVAVRLYRARQPLTEPPLREWTFSKPNGHERISLNDYPIAVYRITAIALDAQGQPIADPSVPVPVEYGGWRAWSAPDKGLNPDLRGQAPPFEGLLPGGGPLPPALSLSPATLVLNPKESAEITVQLQALPETEEVDWELVGDGSLEKTEGRHARYRAPDEPGPNQVATVRARSKTRPDLTAQTVILITSMKKESLKEK